MADMKFAEIKYPSMRSELIYNLKKLADLDYQNRVWVAKKYPENVEFDSFDLVVNFIYDDTPLADDALSMLGVILINKEEVCAICSLVNSLNSLFDKYGTDLSDEEYISKPEWLFVVNMARQALVAIDSGSK